MSHMPKKLKKSEFARLLIRWQRKYGRNDLPWQKSRDPYRRWIAEIMLQQTQVSTVIPYYLEFLKTFPTIEVLAQAEEDEVLALWAGLGYYTRARNLLKCAKEVIEKYHGQFPLQEEHLVKLPGIGFSTAGAILSAVTDKPHVILDGNVKRVLCRYLKVPVPLGESQSDHLLLQEAREFLPETEGATYAQALMDLGATVCKRTNPTCLVCPISAGCKAFLGGEVEQYPVKRAKPKVSKEMLPIAICFQEQKVFLVRQEKRFWKGLWTLPVCEMPKNAKQLKPINHRLTHIELTIVPFLVSPSSIAGIEGRWFSRQELDTVAVPTPIKKLLLSLDER